MELGPVMIHSLDMRHSCWCSEEDRVRQNVMVIRSLKPAFSYTTSTLDLPQISQAKKNSPAERNENVSSPTDSSLQHKTEKNQTTTPRNHATPVPKKPFHPPATPNHH